ncbi:MAG: ergothioneine biosynthesis protein EgtB [Hyphococcus sp.]
MTHPALKMNEDLEDRRALQDLFFETRERTLALCKDLEPEDMVIQAMPDTSPTRWHLAHTTWFLEEFVLGPHLPGFEPYHEKYQFLFNSYYESVGEQWERPHRGLLSRPTVDEIIAYRRATEEHITDLIESVPEDVWSVAAPIIELGVHHEMQHQELMCTDIKYTLGLNPLYPAAIKRNDCWWEASAPDPIKWIEFDEDIYEIGATGKDFVFDNELPRHRQYLHAFALSSRPVTNGEYLAFMEDGGYSKASLWLSEGWDIVNEKKWFAPLHWNKVNGEWHEYTMHGLIPLQEHLPVCHLSAHEAFAMAAWAGARLPTEAELEIALCEQADMDGQFLTADVLVHPLLQGSGECGFDSLAGGVWEWTQSNYGAYPGYAPPQGAVGEYNGKFMCSQLVLKGGSCATPRGHVRPTYRNFFPPKDRWQFSGLRLARDA